MNNVLLDLQTEPIERRIINHTSNICEKQTNNIWIILNKLTSWTNRNKDTIHTGNICEKKLIIHE